MTDTTTTTTTTQPPVRLAAVAYLATIVFGVFAEAGVRSGIMTADAAATIANVARAEALYRLGVASDLLMLIAYVVVTAVFYAVFRPVSRIASLMAALFSAIGIAAQASATLNLLAPLTILEQAGGAATVEQAERAMVFIDQHGYGYTICLIFFGVYCLMIGWLVWRSRLVPRWIGLLMALAGACYLVNSLRVLLGIPLPGGLSPFLLLPGLIGEGAISLWLLFRGLDQERWARLAAGPDRPVFVGG